MYSFNRLNLRLYLYNVLLSFPILQAFVQILNLFLHSKTRLSSTRIVLFTAEFPLIGSIWLKIVPLYAVRRSKSFSKCTNTLNLTKQLLEYLDY